MSPVRLQNDRINRCIYALLRARGGARALWGRVFFGSYGSRLSGLTPHSDADLNPKDVFVLDGGGTTRFSSMFEEDNSRKANKHTVTISPTTDRELYLNELLEAVAVTGRVLVKGDQVYAEHAGKLQLIRKGNLLARLIGRLVNVTQINHSGDAKTINPPAGEGEFILHNHELHSRLPQIRFLTEVPVLNMAGTIARPGLNSDGIYYQGSAIEPRLSRDRLDRLMDVFCFKRSQDRTNFLGFMLTPFLGPRFAGGRPICTIKGNQQGIGKTAAAQVLVLVHSASDRILSVSYNTNDTELEKCIGAVVTQHSCVLIDNARSPANGRVSSPAIERTITLPTFNFRRIGTSESITGDNYLQFILTFNGGHLSSDLSTRSVYIVLEHDGDPSLRPLPAIGDPVEYARRNRNEILAELLGMVSTWIGKDRPEVPVSCRFRPWSRVINGILLANGIEGFLSGHLRDAREGDERQLALEELADARPGEYLRPGQWLGQASAQQLFREQLTGKSQRARETVIGNILKSCVDREVIVENVDANQCSVFRLMRKEDRNGMRYAFMPEVSAAGADHDESRLVAPTADHFVTV
jgi:hypothetical protein